jgi:hypothetical protein
MENKQQKSTKKRWLWFIGLYIVSVVVASTISFSLHWLVHP